MLQQPDYEVVSVGSWPPDVVLWEVGQRNFMVEHLVPWAEP